MRNLPDSRESVSRRPEVVLIDERQWLFLQRRYHLTHRELQVAKLICRGFSNDETARGLRISPGTVKAHLRSIYRRVSVKSKLLLLLRLVEDVTRFYGKSTLAVPFVSVKKPTSIVTNKQAVPPKTTN